MLFKFCIVRSDHDCSLKLTISDVWMYMSCTSKAHPKFLEAKTSRSVVDVYSYVYISVIDIGRFLQRSPVPLLPMLALVTTSACLIH